MFTFNLTEQEANIIISALNGNISNYNELIKNIIKQAQPQLVATPTVDTTTETQPTPELYNQDGTANVTEDSHDSGSISFDSSLTQA